MALNRCDSARKGHLVMSRNIWVVTAGKKIRHLKTRDVTKYLNNTQPLATPTHIHNKELSGPTSH